MQGISGTQHEPRPESSGIGGGFRNEHAVEARAGEGHAENAAAAGEGHVADLAARGKVRFSLRAAARERDADVQHGAEVELARKREGHAAAAEIFAGGRLVKSRAAAIGAANLNRQAHLNALLAAPLDPRRLHRRFAHDCPPEETLSAKKVSTRSKTSCGARERTT